MRVTIKNEKRKVDHFTKKYYKADEIIEHEDVKRIKITSKKDGVIYSRYIDLENIDEIEITLTK